MREFILTFDSLVSFYLFVAVLLHPVAGERGLLLTLDLHLNVGGVKVLEHLNKNLTIHNVPRLVKRKLSLHLDSALGEVAPRITEVIHLFNII